ncbi:hypothetical protein IW261DRAFT_160477 [Armillaria novae-zelandiae]|uniref:Uncharacterized protein n=1 Tax=Armillaria novae-zelandiae TaxID=153914 RepID=A0AA39NCV3_9AGAR|nr:hypothetical protein IW261DRAFT_160477 [Armillaria novae-zelandiae]
MEVGSPRSLPPPFVLALISIILLVLVVTIVMMFYGVFSQSQPRLLRWTNAREVSLLPTVNARRERVQTATAQRPGLGARGLFNPPIVVGPGEHILPGRLRRPEASMTRGTVVVFFQDAYTVLHRQLSVNNYPSARVLDRWLGSNSADRDAV